jgi:hypothetical protein
LVESDRRSARWQGARSTACRAFGIHAVRRRRGSLGNWLGRARDLPGIGGGGRSQFGHDLNLHIAVLQLPFIVLIEQYPAHQPNDGGLIGEDANDIGAPLDLFVEPFERIGSVSFAAVLLGEIQVAQHIGLAVVDEGGELRPFLPQLVGDLAQHGVGLGPIGRQKGLAPRRRHLLCRVGTCARALRIQGTRQRCQAAPNTRRIAAFSPSWASEITSLMPLKPRRAKLFRKLDQKVSACDEPMYSPTISPLPSTLTATAIIAATGTMRPPSRCFR